MHAICAHIHRGGGSATAKQETRRSKKPENDLSGVIAILPDDAEGLEPV
jgi:hypothetical protein